MTEHFSYNLQSKWLLNISRNIKLCYCHGHAWWMRAKLYPRWAFINFTCCSSKEKQDKINQEWGSCYSLSVIISGSWASWTQKWNRPHPWPLVLTSSNNTWMQSGFTNVSGRTEQVGLFNSGWDSVSVVHSSMLKLKFTCDVNFVFV